MSYVYDLILNFNSELYEFFDNANLRGRKWLF